MAYWPKPGWILGEYRSFRNGNDPDGQDKAGWIFYDDELREKAQLNIFDNDFAPTGFDEKPLEVASDTPPQIRADLDKLVVALQEKFHDQPTERAYGMGNGPYLHREDYMAEVRQVIEKTLGLVNVPENGTCVLKEKVRLHDYALSINDEITGQDVLVESFDRKPYDEETSSHYDDYKLKFCYAPSKEKCFYVIAHQYGSPCSRYDVDRLKVLSSSSIEYSRKNTLGFRALKQKDYAIAKKLFLESVQLNPSYRHSNFNLACTLSSNSEPFSSGKIYLERILAQSLLQDTYIKKIETDPDLAFWRSDRDFQPWFDQIKKEAFEREAGGPSLTKQQKQSRNYYSEGQKAYLRKNYQVSLVSFKKAVELDGKFARARIGLASIYAIKGDVSSAVQQLKSANWVDPALTKQKILGDPDFEKLRNHPDIVDILQQ